MYHVPMVDFKCGDKSYPLQLAPERVLSVLRPRAGEPAAPPQQLIERALEGCQAALARFRPGEQVVIVTSDVTRPTGSDLYLPLLRRHHLHNGRHPHRPRCAGAE